MIGIVPTGIKALEETFVPSLNGYKLSFNIFIPVHATCADLPFSISYEYDGEEILRIHCSTSLDP